MTKAKIMEANSIVKVRLLTFKSLRHYGGREITTTAHIGNAKYLFSQQDSTHVVELLQPLGNFKAGHKIAVLPANFNI